VAASTGVDRDGTRNDAPSGIADVIRADSGSGGGALMLAQQKRTGNCGPPRQVTREYPSSRGAAIPWCGLGQAGIPRRS